MANSEVKKWLEKLKRAEKSYKDYFDLVDETRAYYKAGKSGDKTQKKADNIFWSSIETQKPFLYFKRPVPYVERVNKIASPVEQAACKILERALEWDFAQFDFDSVAKYARNDYLISGCGVLWEQYSAEVKDDSKQSEVVKTEYIDPSKFLIDAEKVGVWEEVTWIAKKIYMSKQEAIEQFGQKAEVLVADYTDNDQENDRKKEICVYEVWDKLTRQIYWIYDKGDVDFLKIAPDTLNLNGFFPCPKPIFATLSNDSLIPTPDYTMIKQMLDELNGITERMRLTMQALKVSGVYDSSYSKLADIFEKDVTLVALADFSKLKAAGGISGVVDFAPIDQYIKALETLAQRRDDLIQRIFEITGVSDIMRGNSNPDETATAVAKKTNFGTLRNQDRQNDMQRFIRDLYRIKAEIICQMFDVGRLEEFIKPEDGYDQPTVLMAVQMLKNGQLNGFVLNVETEAVFNQAEEAKNTIESVQTVSKLITEAMPNVSAQPLLLPLYRQMIESVVATLPKARMFESVIEKTFADIESDLNKPKEQPQPNPIEAQKVQNQYEIDKEKNALKAREIDIKQKESETNLALKNKEMNLQAELKASEIEKDREVNSNITTGYVKAF